MSTQQRADRIVEVLVAEFGEHMAEDPAAFRRKFRKMAASPFAFYRGSAALFYADLTNDFADDSFLDERTSRVWIHGDLHAENFGTYMSGAGQLVFNVNDFDEAYVGPFIWDLKRFAGSVALIGYAKALSDDMITDLVTRFATAYLTELRAIVAGGEEAIGSITLENANGVLRRVLQQARLNTRVDLLNGHTTVDNYERRFSLGDGVFEIDQTSRAGGTSTRCRWTGRPGGRSPFASRTWCCARGWASDRPACRRTTCCWRGTRRRWRTTSSST
jgi:uncharacterized protein (DUF2252 family)